MNENSNADMKRISKDAVDELCEILSKIVVKGEFTGEDMQMIVSVSRWVDVDDIPEDEEIEEE